MPGSPNDVDSNFVGSDQSPTSVGMRIIGKDFEHWMRVFDDSTKRAFNS